MKCLGGILIAALTSIGAATAHAAAIHYEGTIAPPVATVTGSIGGFGYVREVAAEVDFWSFAGLAGSQVSIRGTRLDAGLDPVLDLYFGTTTADDSLFRTGQSWGGLQYLATSDDVIDPPSGPFGDPFLSFTLPSTGNYTIAIGGGGSDGEGPYRYSLSVQAVPEPESWAMMLIGSCLLGGWLRRRDKRGAQG
jgi:hypothetical protein